MALTPVWRGSRLIQLQPGSPKEVQSASGTKIELIYRGPFVTLRAQRPKIGQSVAGYPNKPVEEIQIYPDEAGTTGPGTMRVSLNNASEPGDMITTGANDVTLEVEWVDVGRSIEQHPRYTAGATKITDTGVIGGVTTSLASIWDEIKAAQTAKDREAAMAKIQSVEHRNLIRDLSVKYLSGITSYISPAPVARRTTTTYLKPSSTAMGLRVTKPFQGCPDGYEWLKTADKSIKQGGKGKWERVEEWTGAEKWDPDLYPAG